MGLKFLIKIAQMIFVKCFISFLFLCINVCPLNYGDFIPENHHLPTVQIAFLVRNKAHALPYFLGNLERLNYPKDRISLFIRSDRCVDKSNEILEKWLNHSEHQYHSVDYINSDLPQYPNEEYVSDWTKERFQHVIKLKEEALTKARKSWADYLFLVDSDAMIIDENILQHLMENQVPIVSPLLKCTDLGSFSNFWGGMTDQGYYKRSKNYFNIQERKTLGVFKVPMIHTIYLINLNLKVNEKLSFLSNKDLLSQFPFDDVIQFAKFVENINSEFYIDNRYEYGYLTSPVEQGSLFREQEIFDHMKFQIMLDREDSDALFILKVSEFLQENLPAKTKLGLDEIYMVNLKRRTDRKEKMDYLFDQLGIDAKYFEAVDGRNLNETYLNELGVKQMPGYSDPYHNRDLKMGEIGCFLSHYFIWQDMLEKNYERILIFEDDIRFGPGFKRSLSVILSDADTYKNDWELLYIGRKRMSDKESLVKRGVALAYPDYTYWTLGYILKRSGAEKLLQQKPLGKMLAVDEYLPIMFDRHPRNDWKSNFHPRNLVALSSEPLLLEPTHYTGEPNHISDTEDSVIVENATIVQKKVETPKSNGKN